MFFQPIIILGILALACFFLLVVCSILGWLVWKKKWKALAIFITLIAGLIGIGASFVLLRTSIQNSHAASLKSLSPEVTDWSKVDAEFWSWQGDFDWFRTPVRYPYDLHSIDTPSAHGFLNRNIRAGHSSEPTRDGETKLDDIEAFSTDQALFLFRQRSRDGSPDRWGIFTVSIAVKRR